MAENRKRALPLRFPPIRTAKFLRLAAAHCGKSMTFRSIAIHRSFWGSASGKGLVHRLPKRPSLFARWCGKAAPSSPVLS